LEEKAQNAMEMEKKENQETQKNQESI
jgi:hypothetical protein